MPRLLSFFILTAILSAVGGISAQPRKTIKAERSLQKIRTFFPPDDSRLPEAIRAPASALPLRGVTAVTRTTDGAIWIGTPEGLLRIDHTAPPRDRAQYFASRRYLPDDHVTALAPDGRNVWVRTATGAAHIELRPMTLLEKAALFEQRIRERHDRWGLVADSAMRVPGDLSSNLLVSNDNDGLWTAMYAAAKCFEYAVTKSPNALARAKRATEAVLFLEEVTGRPGYPARSYIKEGEPKPKDGFWYKSADGKIEWKSDTSSDEIVGHFFIFSIAHDLLPDEALKRKIRGTARRMMDHILDNGLYLIDVTGKPTRWGRWSPEYFATSTGRPDAPLNALELLMFLKVTNHLTGDAKYAKEYERVAWQMGYSALTTKYLDLQEELNYSDEELAMLSFYPLFLYEKDPKLLALYREALEQWWKNEQRELNPLWTFIYSVANPQREAGLEGALWTLYRIPMDLVKWTIRNSHRADVTMAAGKDRHGRAEALVLSPPDERPVMKWNGNPFVVDGGVDGRGEDDGAFFLLPYWLGRYHGILLGE